MMFGNADAYVFASKGCKKWDTCAPEAVLCAAGGELTDIHGENCLLFPMPKPKRFGLVPGPGIILMTRSYYEANNVISAVSCCIRILIRMKLAFSFTPY